MNRVLNWRARGTSSAFQAFDLNDFGREPMKNDSETETRRRALAAEGALLLLVDRLAMRGTISIDEGEEILAMLSKSSDMSAARVSHSRHILRQLRQLRGGKTDETPGAPAGQTQ